jgi:tetratricopeptide (TPR) repeat protein
MQNEIDIFFGREDQIDEKLMKLENSHFLMVLGPSGCGKSSLVRTGLLNALKSGFMMSAGTKWRIADFKPGDAPLWNLSAGLYTALKPERGATNSDILSVYREIADWHAILSEGIDGLMRIVKDEQLPSDTNLLLLADQFEEIFRFRDLVPKGKIKEDTKFESEEFVALLLEAARQRELPIYVIMTMRTGFLEKCFEFDGLPVAINSSQFLTPVLNKEQLLRAIVGPAKVFGGNVNSDLVDRLISDMSPNPDDLPLLQHVLMRIWHNAKNRDRDKPVIMTLDDYKTVGGLRSALSNHADEALNYLEKKDPNNLFLTKILFQELTERTDGSITQNDIRRPRRVSEIAKVANLQKNQWQRISNLVEVFRDPSRCFITTRSKLETSEKSVEDITKDTVLDISHESLIRRWFTLKNWVSEEAQKAKDYKDLVREMKDYKEERRGLLDELKVQHYNEWLQKNKPTIQWAERYSGPNDLKLAMEFLEESQDALNKKKIAEKEAAQKEQQLIIDQALEKAHAKRVRNALIASILIIVVIAIVGTIFFFDKMYLKHMNAAEEFLSERKYVKAIKYCDKALSFDDDDHRVYIVKGIALFHEEDYNEAIISFKAGNKISPNSYKLHVHLGHTYAKLNNEEKAFSHYEKAIKLSPLDIEERVFKFVVDSLLRLKNGKVEIKNIQYAIKLAPRLVEVTFYDKVIQALITAGNNKKADYYEKLKNEVIKANKYEEHRNKGYKLLEVGEDKMAIAEIKKALAIKPNAKDYITIGYTLIKTNNEDDAIEAITYLREAIKVDPDKVNADVYTDVGGHFLNAKKYEEASEHFKKALKLMRQDTGQSKESDIDAFKIRIKTKLIELGKKKDYIKEFLKDVGFDLTNPNKS